MDPSAYIGRCPEQVDEFLRDWVDPVLQKYAEALDRGDTELNV